MTRPSPAPRLTALSVGPRAASAVAVWIGALVLIGWVRLLRGTPHEPEERARLSQPPQGLDRATRRLAEAGLVVARRTVSKHRRNAGLPAPQSRQAGLPEGRRSQE